MRGERITAAVRLPESLDGFQKLTIYADMPDRTFSWFAVPVKELERRRGKPQFFIEEEKVQQGFLRIRGWVVADGPVRIQIFDEKKQKVQAEILRTERVDVEQLYEETEIQDKTGFFAELTNLTGKLLYMVFYAGDKKSVRGQKIRAYRSSPAGSGIPKEIGKVRQKRNTLLEKPGKRRACGKDRFQGKNSVHQRDPLSEMDPAPSAGPQGTGETAP